MQTIYSKHKLPQRSKQTDGPADDIKPFFPATSSWTACPRANRAVLCHTGHANTRQHKSFSKQFNEGISQQCTVHSERILLLVCTNALISHDMTLVARCKKCARGLGVKLHTRGFAGLHRLETIAQTRKLSTADTTEENYGKQPLLHCQTNQMNRKPIAKPLPLIFPIYTSHLIG